MKSKGFTLLDMMIVVAIIGILATIAVPSYYKYNADAKAVEAKINLDLIGKGALTFYSEEHVYDNNGFTVRSGEYPSRYNDKRKKYNTGSLPAIGGMPYEGKKQHDGNSSIGIKHSPKDYEKHFNSYPWIDLHFRISSPFYFSYNYEGTLESSGKAAKSRFAASASACLISKCTTEWTCDYGYIVVGTPSGKISPLIDNSDFHIEHCGKARVSVVKKSVSYYDYQ